MKKAIMMFAAMVLIAAPALADIFDGPGDTGYQMYSERLSDYYQGRGGEFTLKAESGFAYLSNVAYADVAKGKDGTNSFQTFCVEVGEVVQSPMKIMVSQANVGGVYGSGSHAYMGGTGVGDNLDPETAWLYTQFATGNLATLGYDYTPGDNREASAGALQRLIWNIEGEGGDLGVGDTWYGITLTQDQVDLITEWNDAYAESGWSGIGRVRVLQTNSSTGGSLAQDQLYLVPAPAAIGLGVLGLALVGWLKRRVG
ncbi:MAG: hypothetical protein NTU94_09535 [Planctomycetota bacterium]|nr:hypothetical protein [Planctomycetota bacterium]